MKKTWPIIGFLLLLTIPFAAADPLTDLLTGIWDKVLRFGSLESLGLTSEQSVAGLLRIFLGILTFAIFYAAINFGRSLDTFKFLKGNHAMVISLVLAVMTSILLPVQVLLAFGTGIGLVFSSILILGPVIGVAYSFWKLEPDTRGILTLKTAGSFILFYMMNAMAYALGQGGFALPGITEQIVTTMTTLTNYALLFTIFMIIYYLFKLVTFSTEDEEKAVERRRKEVGKWAKRKWRERERAKKISPMRDYLVKAIGHGEDLVGVLYKGKTPAAKEAAVRVARKELKELQEKLNTAIDGLRRAQRKESGDLAKFLGELRAECQNAYRLTEEIEIPLADDPDWKIKVNHIEVEVISSTPSINYICGAVLELLNSYIEKEEIVLASRP